jgi:hypothetical protein
LGQPVVKEECQDIPPAGVFQKDSASYVGTCIHFWANVFQFDANTGPCSFLGFYGNYPAQYNFQYEGGTVRVDGREQPTGVSVADGSRSVPGGTCGLLGPIVDGDNVEVWGVVDSVDSYSTTVGGTNTYTIVKIVDIAKVG